MTLITDNAALLEFVPNSIAAVKGETPLFDKIAVHLATAEDWLTATFLGNTIAENMPDNLTDTALRCCRQIVAAEALRLAIPSLDLVVTPNGFAVTQTSNLTPASKQRVDRLLGSMLTLRDNAIAQLLPLLPTLDGWLASDRAAWFGSSLFPTLSIVESIGNVQGSKWDKWLELRPQIIDLEDSAAEEWLSPELLAVLRRRNLDGSLSEADKPLIRAVKSQIVAYLQNGTFNARRWQDIVNYIRLRPDDFPQWHVSDTARLFSPPVFTNRKSAPGYFF